MNERSKSQHRGPTAFFVNGKRFLWPDDVLREREPDADTERSILFVSGEQGNLRVASIVNIGKPPSGE